jgi:MFS family permease
LPVEPTWASFSHMIGRKSVLLAALFLFTAGTIIASVARTITHLLVGRCFQGSGGGGLVGLTYVLLADLVSLRERGKWMSIISLQWAIGSVIGPVIGGAMALDTTWRWIFWLNIPFCVLAAVGVPICLKLHPREGSVWERLKDFDWFGSFIFIAATTSFLIPITWVSSRVPLRKRRTNIFKGRRYVRMEILANTRRRCWGRNPFLFVTVP